MSRPFLLRFFGVFLLLAGVTFFAYVYYQDHKQVRTPLVYSDRTMLQALWNDYKQVYWESGSGRTLDKQQNDITTSEGQSYTMLRAVWVGDKAVFDKTYEFTKTQMQHKNDALFGWRWGKKSDGTYGVLTEQNGQNAASDADSDISLALLMAANRWQQASYRTDAQRIISDIWEKEVITIKGKPYLTANDLESSSTSATAIINPSYLSPYAYKHFAKIDKTHDWNKLVDSSYVLLNEASQSKLGSDQSSGLIPDWVLINKTTGELSPSTQPNLTTNYSYDAMRTPWRLALDWQWNKDDRAKDTLKKLSILTQKWEKENKLVSSYKHNGDDITSDEGPFTYGTSIGYFMIQDEKNAKTIYDQKLKSLYNPTSNKWKEQLSYYDDNWAWFGMALYDNALPNLAK